MTRQYNVTLAEVSNAWKSVRKAGGACGYDNQTISNIEKDLENQIYKIDIFPIKSQILHI